MHPLGLEKLQSGCKIQSSIECMSSKNVYYRLISVIFAIEMLYNFG